MSNVFVVTDLVAKESLRIAHEKAALRPAGAGKVRMYRLFHVPLPLSPRRDDPSGRQTRTKTRRLRRCQPLPTASPQAGQPGPTARSCLALPFLGHRASAAACPGLAGF